MLNIDEAKAEKLRTYYKNYRLGSMSALAKLECEKFAKKVVMDDEEYELTGEDPVDAFLNV